jgi:anti-sigma factor RsiW
MSPLDAFRTLSPEWKIATALVAGLLAALVAVMFLRSLMRRRIEDDPEYQRRHSILPESVDRVSGGSDPFSQGSFHERRSAPRRKGNPVSVQVSDARAKTAPVPGFVVDRSLQGLGLEVGGEMDVEVGMVLSVRPRSSGSQPPWTQVVVRNCREDGPGWRLGCEYVTPPRSEVRMLFG